MSTYVSVVISPDTTTSPVLTSVSHATRPYGSSRSTASRTPPEIWSAILSGGPSVTGPRVNRRAVRDLVGDLVRVALGDGLGREQVLVVGQVAHGIRRGAPGRGVSCGARRRPLRARARDRSWL